MITDENMIDVINSIVERQIVALQKMSTEDQTLDDVEERLIQVIKKEFSTALENLNILYNDFIDKDDCTLAVALQYVPLFAVYGLWIAAQMGVAQDEFYVMVDHYLNEFNLVED